MHLKSTILDLETTKEILQERVSEIEQNRFLNGGAGSSSASSDQMQELPSLMSTSDNEVISKLQNVVEQLQ